MEFRKLMFQLVFQLVVRIQNGFCNGQVFDSLMHMQDLIGFVT